VSFDQPGRIVFVLKIFIGSVELAAAPAPAPDTPDAGPAGSG
jgi:hypothetical protein